MTDRSPEFYEELELTLQYISLVFERKISLQRQKKSAKS